MLEKLLGIGAHKQRLPRAEHRVIRAGPLEPDEIAVEQRQLQLDLGVTGHDERESISLGWRVARPGDELVTEVELERLSARGGWGRGRATVDGKVACEARLFFALANAE